MSWAGTQPCQTNISPYGETKKKGTRPAFSGPFGPNKLTVRQTWWEVSAGFFMLLERAPTKAGVITKL